MKTRAIILLFIVMIILLSCSKERTTSNLNSLNGKWKWIETSEGISGKKETPATTGKIINLQISEQSIKKYENGSLISDLPYTLKTNKSFFGDVKQILVFDGIPSQSYKIEGNQLKFFEECNDCLIYKYVKEEN
jgi:hypothetical protein